MSRLRVWPSKRGSQSLARATCAALALILLANFLFSRLGGRTPRVTVHSATEESENSFDWNDKTVSSYLKRPTTGAGAPGKAQSRFSSCLSRVSTFLEFFSLSTLPYQGRELCKGLCSSPSPDAVRSVDQVDNHSLAAPRKRRHGRSSPPHSIPSDFENFFSARLPLLIYTSATRVRLGASHKHQTEHGARSGVLMPGDGSSSSEEESDEDEDTVLTGEDQAEEEECAAQRVLQDMLEADFNGSSDSLMATSVQWLKLKDVLLRRMNNKQACAAPISSDPVCRVVSADDSGGGGAGGRNLPCGGERYERLIERFLNERNCLTAMALSHTLSQSWLGLPHADEAAASSTGVSETSITVQPVGDKAEHSRALAAKGGLLGILTRQYQQVIDSGALDSSLSTIYSSASQLLSDFKTAAIDGLNAFNSLALRDALLVRREQQVGLLCSFGEGKKAELGSSVLSTDNNLIVRVNSDGHDQVMVKAFIDAVSTFGNFVRALLEDGGLADRALETHKAFYKFRFEKMQALMQNIEPNVVVHTSNALLNALPLEKHKKHKHKKSKPSRGAGSEEGTQGVGSGGDESSGGSVATSSFSQLSASRTKDYLPVTFLQLVAEQNEAFIKQQAKDFLLPKNGAGTYSEGLPASFLQESATLQISQLLPMPPYGTPPPSPPPQAATVFVTQPMPLPLDPSLPAGTAALAQGSLQPTLQPPVDAFSVAPATLTGAQQPFPGQIGQQQPAGGGGMGLPPPTMQPLPLAQLAVGAVQQQQQPQQLQQQQQQTPALALAQPTLQQQSGNIYGQHLPQQGQPMQMGQFVQQPGQQPQQQQGQPQQQQQLGQPQQQQQLGQPQQQQQPQGQAQEPQPLLIQRLQPLQQVGEQPSHAQGQGMQQMQPLDIASGTKLFSQEGQATQGGASHSRTGAAPGALGSEAEAEREGSNVGAAPQRNFSPQPFTEKGVPVKQKLSAVISRLRMFKMDGDTVLFDPDEVLIDKIVRAGFYELNDRVFTAWGSLLPQAAVTTSAELLTMLLPIPEVDLAMFYNKTLHDDGRITDGYTGPLPLDDATITQRFSHFVEETYRDCWRTFFARNDNLMEEPSPPPFPAQQQRQTSGSPPGTSFSSLQMGHAQGHLSLAAETEQLTRNLQQTAQAAQSLPHETRKGQREIGPLAPKQSLQLLERPTVLVQVEQHTNLSAQGGQRIAPKSRRTVTLVESSDGVDSAELQKQFVNEGVVQERTVAALQSRASRTLSGTMMQAAASAAMALLTTFLLVGF